MRTLRRSWSEAALHVIFDAHWWANFVPSAETENTVDATAISADALMAMTPFG